MTSRPLLVAADAVPLVDLRPLGAPVSPYACEVHRLVVNGQAVPLARPTLAIIDTGTTGLVISDTLYTSDELPLRGAAIRDVVVELKTESGRIVRLHAGRRRGRRGAEAARRSSSRRALPSLGTGDDERPEASPRIESFDLIVTPVQLPWFTSPPRKVTLASEKYRSPAANPAYYRASATEALSRAAEESLLRDRFAPHVLFLGLSFLSNTLLTIDADAGRMVIDHEKNSGK